MAPTSEPRVLERDPSSLPLMLKAALPAVPVLNQVPGVRRTGSSLPDLTLTRHDVPVDRARVAAYSEVCGFPLKDTLPITYTSSTLYEVDEDRDGRSDRMLILEQSDSLA